MIKQTFMEGMITLTFIRYAHTNIIALDWQALSHFYQAVFACKPVPPERNLHGKWLEELTGIPEVHIVGEHLRLPGYDDHGPTLEIFSYQEMQETEKALNHCGFSHIAFEVDDVNNTVDQLLAAGGSLVGEVVSEDYGELGIGTFAYANDIEGNIIELQSWEK